MVDNPVQTQNAHDHKKNHLGEIESWWKFLELAHNQLESPDTDITFYPYLTPIVEDTLKQYVENINLMAEKNISVVVIKKTKLIPYMSERSGIEDGYEMQQFLSNNPDIDQKMSIKEIREIASIRLIPQMTGWLGRIDKEYGSFNSSVLVLQDDEILNHTESSMEKIFRHHNFKMDFSRLEHWRKIANDWRSKIVQSSEFFNQLPEICEAVIKGFDLKLDDYKIGFLEQSLMMAHLMKDYGRRLLLPDDKFPKGTKDLHRFLK